jgi:hypothetical protein
MTPVTITVRTATGAYPVVIGDGLLQGLRRLLDERGLGARRFAVSNPLVWRLHGEPIQRALPGVVAILVPDGERHKNLPTVSRIYDSLLRADADRGSVVLAVGGGVIGDMAGFAAATFLRGIPLVQIPTTLLAQVDASTWRPARTWLAPSIPPRSSSPTAACCPRFRGANTARGCTRSSSMASRAARTCSRGFDARCHSSRTTGPKSSRRS